MKKPFFFLWGCILVLMVFFWIYLPTLSRYRDLKLRQDEVEMQLSKMDVKLKDIKEERDLLRNDVEYLEKVIRDELGLVKPGEIVYKFVEEKKAAAQSAAAQNFDPTLAAASDSTEAVLKSAPAKPSALPAVSQKLQSAVTSTSSSAAAKKITAARTLKSVKTSEPVYPRQETR